MRTKVFTERDRRLLERWLENGEEPGGDQEAVHVDEAMHAR